MLQATSIYWLDQTDKKYQILITSNIGQENHKESAFLKDTDHQKWQFHEGDKLCGYENDPSQIASIAHASMSYCTD